MSDVVMEKIKKKRVRLLKHSFPKSEQFLPRNPDRYQYELSEFATMSADFLTGSHADRSGRRAMQQMCAANKFNSSDMYAVGAGDMERAELAFARNVTQLFAYHDSCKKRANAAYLGAFSQLADFIMSLHAIGWHDQAVQYCTDLFTSKNAERFSAVAPLTQECLFGWFAI